MVKITKVEVWYYPGYNFMTGVRATLSNGRQSPIFKTIASETNEPAVLRFDQISRSKFIAVRSREDGVYGLKVSNKFRKESIEWCGDMTQKWIEQEIPNGEQIAGIYGLNGYGGKGIQNFGFITISYI